MRNRSIITRYLIKFDEESHQNDLKMSLIL